MAALVWRCLLGLAPAYLVEFCGPTQCTELSLPPFSQSRSSPCAICTHLHQTEACLCSGWPLNLEWPPFGDTLTPLSQTFLSQLKAVLFGRVGVGSASE